MTHIICPSIGECRSLHHCKESIPHSYCSFLFARPSTLTWYWSIFLLPKSKALALPLQAFGDASSLGLMKDTKRFLVFLCWKLSIWCCCVFDSLCRGAQKNAPMWSTHDPCTIHCNPQFQQNWFQHSIVNVLLLIYKKKDGRCDE